MNRIEGHLSTGEEQPHYKAHLKISFNSMYNHLVILRIHKMWLAFWLHWLWISLRGWGVRGEAIKLAEKYVIQGHKIVRKNKECLRHMIHKQIDKLNLTFLAIEVSIGQAENELYTNNLQPWWYLAKVVACKSPLCTYMHAIIRGLPSVWGFHYCGSRDGQLYATLTPNNGVAIFVFWIRDTQVMMEQSYYCAKVHPLYAIING